MEKSKRKAVGIWLMIGVVMILFQIVLGGITRLTESGLSITEWEVVTGTVPPISEADWQEEFDEYKASPQYQKVNRGMSLSEFKTIFFWEWFHRLWGRVLGFVFLIPFAFFLAKRYLNRSLIQKAIIAFVLGGLVGVFGWLMVASGLNDRPMVSPYKLAIHLFLAIITICFIYYVGLQLLMPKDRKTGADDKKYLKKFSIVMVALIAVQIFFGALVSGMRAAPFYPTWPDMNHQIIPAILMDFSNYTWNKFIHFEQYAFAGAFVQFFHRNIAYLIFFVAIVYFIKGWRKLESSVSKQTLLTFSIILIAQIVLGIFTLLNSWGHAPVALGVIHQGVAILLLLSLLTLIYRLSSGKNYLQPDKPKDGTLVDP